MKILHFTHTNISLDNRILKELNSLVKVYKDMVIHGYGVDVHENNITMKNKLDSKNFTLLKIFSSKIIFLPFVLKYIFFAIELWVRLLFVGIREKPYLIQ